MGCLKAGIVYADVITTVSPRYAREITTEELGCGLDGLLRQRNSSLVGILNGVDYDEWNTVNDPYLKHSYSAADLSGKLANKLELQKEFGLPVDASIPLFGSIGRLAEQKGVEIMLGALEEMLATNMQFVAVGSGAPAFQRAYRTPRAATPIAGCRADWLRRRVVAPHRGRLRFLPDAVPFRAVRPQPDVRPALRNHSDRRTLPAAWTIR